MVKSLSNVDGRDKMLRTVVKEAIMLTCFDRPVHRASMKSVKALFSSADLPNLIRNLGDEGIKNTSET